MCTPNGENKKDIFVRCECFSGSEMGMGNVKRIVLYAYNVEYKGKWITVPQFGMYFGRQASLGNRPSLVSIKKKIMAQ